MDAGIAADEASIEARMILQHVCGSTSAKLLANHSETFPQIAYQQLELILNRRETREPLAYILGEKEFYGLSFKVDRRTLIPRPETEMLIDLCIEFVSQNHLESPKICDIGTGSGCIAVALATHLPQADITATDIDRTTLEVAKINAESHNAKVTFKLDDARRPDFDDDFDIVAANPPYIRSDVLGTLEPEVRVWEPQQALDGGSDGMRVLEPLIRSIPDLQKGRKPTATFIEMDPPIAAESMRTARDTLPDRHIEIRRDYAGLERFLIVLNV